MSNPVARRLVEELRGNKMYFLRQTDDPKGDIKRGFSCYVSAWHKRREDALVWQQDYGSLNNMEPKLDPATGLWCADPELGLSSYAFNDEESFSEAMWRIWDVVGFRDKVGVFVSSDFDLGVGADGEDVFRKGKFLGWLKMPRTVDDITYANVLRVIGVRV